MPDPDKLPSLADLNAKSSPQEKTLPSLSDLNKGLKKKVPTTGSVESQDLSQGVPGGVLTEELAGSTSELEPSTSALPESLIDLNKVQQSQVSGAVGAQPALPQDAGVVPEQIQQPQITEPPIGVTGPVRTQQQAELGTPAFNEQLARQQFEAQDQIIKEEAISKKKSVLPSWMGIDIDPETGKFNPRDPKDVTKELREVGLKKFVSIDRPTEDINYLDGSLKLEETDPLREWTPHGTQVSQAGIVKQSNSEKYIKSLESSLTKDDNELIRDVAKEYESKYFGNIDDLSRFDAEAGPMMEEFRKSLPEDMSNFNKERIVHGAAVRIQDKFEQRKAQLDKDRRMLELESSSDRKPLTTEDVIHLENIETRDGNTGYDDEFFQYKVDKVVEREGFVHEGNLINKLGAEEYAKNIDERANLFYNEYEKIEKVLTTKLNELYKSDGNQLEINKLETQLEELRFAENSQDDPLGYLLGDVTGKTTKIYDPTTESYVNPGEASQGVIDWNNRVNSEALELSKTNGVDDLKALQSRYYSEMKYLESLGEKSTFAGRFSESLKTTKARFAAVSKALDLNKSIVDVKRNALDRVGESALETIGFDIKTDEDYVLDYIDAQQNKGGLVTTEERDRAEQRFIDKVATTVGGSIPVMLEIMFWTAVTEGAGFAGAVERGGARLAGLLAKGGKNEKLVKGIAKVVTNATNREVQFQLAGESGGAGESLGADLGTALGGNLAFLGNSKVGRVLRTGLTQVGRATGETIEEYSGELFTELMKDQTFSEAFGTVIGDDPFEKLAITYITGAVFALGKAHADWKGSELTKEQEKFLLAYEGDNEIINEAKATAETFNKPKEGEQLKLDFEGEDIVKEDVKVEAKKEADIVPVEKTEKGDTEYKIGEDFFSEKEIKENLDSPEFVEKVKSGDVELKVINPSPEIETALQESGLIEEQVEDVKEEITPEEKVVETPIEGEQQITQPTEGEVETKIEEDAKDKETKIEEAKEAEVLAEPVKTIKETTLESLEKDLEGEFVSPEAKEDIQGKIDQLKTEIEEEVVSIKEPIEQVKEDLPPVEDVVEEVDLKKVPKTITKRFIESGGLTEVEANKIAEISQKTPQTNEGRLKVISDIESEVGLDKAFDIISNEKTNKTFSEETKNYFSIAKANDLKARALKAPTKQERSKLIEQAANIMAKVAKSAEKKGAENQFFNAIYDKFPEMRTKASVVNNINQKIQAALESESDARGLTVGEEIGDLKSKIEQEVRKQIESEVEALKSEIEQLRTAKPGKARVVKGRKQVNEALAEIKKIKSRKGPTSAGASFIPGVSADMINAVGKLIAGYVNIGIGSTKAIISKVTKDLKDADVVISAEDIARIAEKDNSFAELSKDEQIEQFASKNIELALEDFFVNGNSSKETLAGHLSERLNIPLSDAKKISTKLEEKVLGKVEEIAKSELEKDLKITDDLTEEEKTRRRKKQRESGKIVNKVSKSVMLGSLSNTDFRNAFSEKYGFPEVTAEQMSLLEDLVNDAKRFEKSGQRELHQKTQRRINTELRKMKPKDADFYANLIMELAYTNVLSGINTQGNANIGAVSTSIVHAVGKSLEQLGRGKLGAVSYGLRGIGKSYKAASAAAKEARRFNYSKFTDHNAYMEGATDLEMSVLESEVTQGTGHYLRKVSREKSLTENTKNIVRSIRSVLLQYSRMNFLLNASDAFLTTSFTEFNNAIEVYNQETKADGIKGTVNNIVNRKDLIKRLDKAMGYDNRAQIDATVDNEIKAEEEKIDKEVDELLLTPKEAKREKKRRKDLTISKGYKSRRTQELLTQRRDREIYDNAVKTARDWIMLSDPDGIFGMANESFKKFLKLENKKTIFGKAFATFLGLNIMFTRMTAKTANAVMTSIPVLGLIPTLVGYTKKKNGEWSRWPVYKGRHDPLLMKRRIVANMLMTTAAATVFAEMFEWDDDEDEYRLDPNRLIDVTVGGFGGTNAIKNQQSLKNYSGYGLAVSFRSSPEEEFGPYRSLKYLPQALPAFAVLGNYADRTRGLGTDKKLDKFNEQEGVWKLINGASASIAVSQMLEGSFNSIGRATQKISMSDSENFLEGLGTAGFDMVMSPVKTVTQPNFYRDLINESGMRGDFKKAYPKDLWGKIKYDYFGLDGAEENKTDIFGNEYPIQNKFSQWGHGTMNESYNNKEWKLIHKFPEVTITPFKAKEEINLDGHTVKLKDEDLIKEYSDIQKTKLKTLITNDKTYSRFNKLEAENLQLGLNKLRSKSIEAAKKEMIKKYIGTDKIEIIK